MWKGRSFARLSERALREKTETLPKSSMRVPMDTNATSLALSGKCVSFTSADVVGADLNFRRRRRIVSAKSGRAFGFEAISVVREEDAKM